MSRQRDEITLHPKYGLNPSVGICFWCGKETGEIILFGNELKEEAPRRSVVSYAPCGECADKWNQGHVLISYVARPIVDEQVPMKPGVYPTGDYMVISNDAAERLLGEEASRGASLIPEIQFRSLSEKRSDELPNNGE